MVFLFLCAFSAWHPSKSALLYLWSVFLMWQYVTICDRYFCLFFKLLYTLSKVSFLPHARYLSIIKHCIWPHVSNRVLFVLLLAHAVSAPHIYLILREQIACSNKQKAQSHCDVECFILRCFFYTFQRFVHIPPMQHPRTRQQTTQPGSWDNMHTHTYTIYVCVGGIKLSEYLHFCFHLVRFYLCCTQKCTMLLIHM